MTGTGPDPHDRPGPAGREFFTTRTVAEALAGFRPSRRTTAETVRLADALDRVPAASVTAPHALPGFARSTVDGYAVRAADTYGVSDGLPGYLDVVGAVRMGTAPPPDVGVGPGRAVSMPTGGVLPPGAHAVGIVQDTPALLHGAVEGLPAVPPGDGGLRAAGGGAPRGQL